jgi:hypothetical protein
MLAIFIALIACWNGLRLGEAIFYWKTLFEYDTHPLYISISGGAWLFIGLLLSWAVWKGISWGWNVVVGGTAIYTSWYWLDRFILQEPHANWPFVMIINIILLTLIFWILLSQSTRRFFTRDVYERQPETPTTT